MAKATRTTRKPPAKAPARNEDRPLSAKEQRFIRYYVMPDVRDIEKAAQMAGLKPSDGKRLYNDPIVRAEIDRRLRLVELEQAKLDAEHEVLTIDFLETNLRQVVELDPKTHSREKLNGIKLGYVVKGKIRANGSEAIQAQQPIENPQGPSFYRAFEQTMTIRELTTPVPDVPARVVDAERAPRTVLSPPPKTEEVAAGSGRVYRY